MQFPITGRVPNDHRAGDRSHHRLQLERAGVPARAIHRAPWCTACSGGLFFSYRREGLTGRFGTVAALTCGLTPGQAAVFGNVVASITIRKVGVTGEATPEEIMQVFSEL